MKAKDLLCLKAELKIRSHAELCRRMGISETSFRRWMEDPEQELPVYFGLAASALLHSLAPFRPLSVSPSDLALYGGAVARRVFGLIDTHEEEVKSRAAELAAPGS